MLNAPGATQQSARATNNLNSASLYTSQQHIPSFQQRQKRPYSAIHRVSRPTISEKLGNYSTSFAIAY
jgi:hypothetical protein